MARSDGVTPTEFAKLMRKQIEAQTRKPRAVSVFEARLFLDQCVTCGLLTRTNADGVPHYLPTRRLVEALGGLSGGDS